MRRILLVVIAATMAWFATLSPLLTSVASAAGEATRTNGVMSYNGKTFNHTDANHDNKLDTLPSGLPGGTDGFVSLDAANKKAYFILVTGNYKTAATGQYVEYSYTPPSTFSSPTNSTSVTIKASNEDGKSTLGEGSTTNCDPKTTGAVGWMVCPIMTFLSSMMDKIYGILTDFLEVKTVTANQQSSIYQLWSIVRDIANVCFVIAILVIIFSQISNLGISNYGIKKMLPRIIIGAILVNLSYWISALAVDVSNLLGYSIHSTFTGVIDRINVNANYNIQTPNWESVTAVVLSGGAGATALGIAALDLSAPGAAISILVPILVGVILAAIIAFLIMAARQALIICFIIISPLAFVAYLLPNTEKYFQKWGSAFMTMLVLFPLFSIIFSGAQIAGIAIAQNAGDNLINIILGMAVQVAPIVVTPLLVKFSGGIIGKFAGIVNNPKKGLIDRSRNWSGGIAQDLKNRKLHGKRRYDSNGNFIGFDQKTKRHGKNKGQPRASAVRAYDTHKRKVEGRRKAYEQIGTNRFNQTAAGQRVGSMERYGSTQGSVLGKRMDNRFLGSEPGRDMEVQSRHLGAENSEIMNRISASQAGQAAEARTRNAATRKKEIDTHFNRTHHDVIRREQMADIDHGVAEDEFNRSTMGHQVDIARREAERGKQQTKHELDHLWNVRNLTNQESQQREVTLHLREDEAKASTAQVESVYLDMKANKEGVIRGSILDASVEANLKKQAFAAAQIVSASAERQAAANLVLDEAITKDMHQNGITYQLDENGKQVLDANGKPIALQQRVVSGADLQTYATGIGRKSSLLARIASKQEKAEDTEAAEAASLQKLMNLSASERQNLATEKNYKITKRDQQGNEVTFDSDDAANRIASIEWIAKNGSYSQKRALLKTSGKALESVGGVPQEKNLNEDISGFVQRTLAANGFSSAAPFFNDISNDEASQGLIESDEDIWFHGFREIREGRLKAEKVAPSSDGGLQDLYKVFTDRKENNENWQTYIAKNIDLIRRQNSTKPADVVQGKIDKFMSIVNQQFDSYYYDLIEETERVLDDPRLREKTNAQSRDVMDQAINEYRNSDQYRAEKAFREQVSAADTRAKAGEATEADMQILAEFANRRKKV